MKQMKVYGINDKSDREKRNSGNVRNLKSQIEFIIICNTLFYFI